MALLLAMLFSRAAITHNGFRLSNAACIFAYLACALACIYIAMWKRWDFEIVGWALLDIFFAGMAFS